MQALHDVDYPSASSGPRLKKEISAPVGMNGKNTSKGDPFVPQNFYWNGPFNGSKRKTALYGLKQSATVSDMFQLKVTVIERFSGRES